MSDILYGYCHCGCGQKTNVKPANNTSRNWVKGEPFAFILGHNPQNWSNGFTKHSSGYIQIWKPSHPRANQKGYVFEHILIVEKALGKPFPEGAEVHHLNGNVADNRPQNLVVCPNRAYHMLLHQRQRALAECGHATWRKCWICKEYDAPENLEIAKRKNNPNKLCPIVHRKCQINYRKNRYALARRAKVNDSLTPPENKNHNVDKSPQGA